MKKLLTLLLIAGIGFSGNGCSASQKIDPKNYRKKGVKLPDKIVMIGGEVMLSRNYDTDYDGKSEISELYFYPWAGKEPSFYGFDYDHDGFLDPLKEIFIDEAMDGWNGNEVKLIDYAKENGILKEN